MDEKPRFDRSKLPVLNSEKWDHIFEMIVGTTGFAMLVVTVFVLFWR